MKRVLFFGIMCFAAHAQATILTVSNNPATIAQHSTIQAAVTAAASGDTIYVHGSPNNYAGFTITNKKLTLIGAGYSPAKTSAHTTVVNTTIALTGAGTAGSELHGLTILTNITVTSLGVNDLRFIRNRIYRNTIALTPSTAGTISGYVFESNFFEDGGLVSNSNFTLQNMIFQNNIFLNSGALLSSNISGFVNTGNVLFDHNLFYGGSTGSRDVFGANTRFVTLSNNIFVRSNAADNLTGGNFYNNITYLTGNDAPWTVGTNFDGGGNIAGTDPQMASQTQVNSGVANPLLDFSIAAGPANNSATDGKDRGLLYDPTGSLNWANTRTSRIPFIYSMQTNTPTVAPGGSVAVTVEARTSN